MHVISDVTTSNGCGMQTKFGGFNISEIWKAGSLGHGTVVPGHYDIDLVLYSRGKWPPNSI